MRRRVITLADVRNARHRLAVPVGTLVTPAARDLARESRVEIVVGTDEPSIQSADGGRAEGTTPSARELAKRIDHTNLLPDATSGDIIELCTEARDFGFVSVCVNPVHVATAVAALRDTSIPVCAAVGFPSGAHSTAIKAAEARACVDDGAREIDMVANTGWLKEGKLDLYAADIRAVREAIGNDVVLKVIIETSLLDEPDMVRAAILCAQSGANFVKSSTGVYGQACLDHVRLLRRALPPNVKIKAAGGIRSAADACAFVAAGADRIGTSSGVGMMWELGTKADFTAPNVGANLQIRPG